MAPLKYQVLVLVTIWVHRQSLHTNSRTWKGRTEGIYYGKAQQRRRRHEPVPSADSEHKLNGWVSFFCVYVGKKRENEWLLHKYRLSAVSFTIRSSLYCRPKVHIYFFEYEYLPPKKGNHALAIAESYACHYFAKCNMTSRVCAVANNLFYYFVCTEINPDSEIRAQGGAKYETSRK